MSRIPGCLAGALYAGLMMLSTQVAAGDYRSPGDMTLEERSAMMQLVGEYNACVYRAGMEKVDAFPDIRQAADAAMEACENLSLKLRQTIDGYNFEPGFGEQFVHHARSRAAKSLLPELALRKGG
ncbi:MAG: hypothetical protein AB7Q76_13485 [Gammaproteobacteria bacterium]